MTSARRDFLATLTTLGILLLSRFALLPSGPWDWDETLFARGILDFDLPAHFPHPPGFPLWVFAGWLMHFFVTEPLTGLQLLSAATSCLALWPLAALGRRVAPPPVATAAALLLLFAPGVWLHAMRGFSCTPAAFFAFWAAALALRPAQRRPVTLFTCLVAAAFLIRPILLPPLGLLWLAGVWGVTPRRRLLPGVAAAVGATVLSVAGMIFAQGSVSEFARSFLVHGRRHARNLLGNTGGFAELGIVKGLGGPTLTLLLVALALVGVAVWLGRVGRRTALAWVAVIGVGVGQLIWLQNRTFSRYAVPFQMAAAPLVAGAAALAPPGAAAAVLLATTASFAGRGLFPVIEQHDRPMPGWEALLFSAELAQRQGFDVVVEPGLFPFWSYLALRERKAGQQWSFSWYLAPSSPDAKGTPPGRYLLVTDRPENYLVAPWERRWRWGLVSGELRPLTSGRFLDAAVIQGALLPTHDWWTVERSPTEAFMWGGAQAELLLPPLPQNTPLGLDLAPAAGPAPLVVSLNGADVAVVPGDAPRLSLPIDPEHLSGTTTNRLTFRREKGYRQGSGDSRPLSVQLFGLTAPPGADHGAQEQVAALLAHADSPPKPPWGATGLHGPEIFPEGRGVWTRSTATFELPLASGILTLRLWAPRPGPVDLHLAIEGEPAAGPLRVGPQPREVSLVLTDRMARAGYGRITLQSPAFIPATTGSSDTRELGVVVGRLHFTPLQNPRSSPWVAVPDPTGSALWWLPIPRWQLPELSATFGWRQVVAADEEYLAGGEGSILPLPPRRTGERLLLEVSVPADAAPALLEIHGQPVAVLLPGAPRRVLDVPLIAGTAGNPSAVFVRRARSGSSEVAVHLHWLRVVAEGQGWHGPVADPDHRARLGVRIEGPVASATPLANPAHQGGGLDTAKGSGSWVELDLPAATGVLRLTVASPRIPAQLALFLNGQLVADALPLGPQPQQLAVALPPPPDPSSTARVGLRATPHEPANNRQLSTREPVIRVLGGELEAIQGYPVARWVLSPPVGEEAWTLTPIPRGAYDPERFGQAAGCWLTPNARLRLPPGTGTLTFTAWAPRPVPSRLEIWHAGVRLVGPVDLPTTPTVLRVPLHSSPSRHRETVLELRAVPYSPRRHHGASDDRELGIVLGFLAFSPQR